MVLYILRPEHIDKSNLTKLLLPLIGYTMNYFFENIREEILYYY